MNSHRIKYLPWAAVLISVAMLVVIFLGIGVTRGRINNLQASDFVYSPNTSKLESNYLKEGGQMVLLSDWEIGDTISSRVETITISSSDKDLSGTLTCSTSSDLLKASVDKTKITATKSGVSVSLTFVLTDSALSLEKVTETIVQVGWIPENASDGKATHWADFYVEIHPENAFEAADDASVGFSSNYLASGGSTVLLNDWSITDVATYRTQDIEFLTYSGEITGTVVYETDSPWVNVTLDNSVNPVRITVNETGKYISTLRISLEEGVSELTEKTQAIIRVSWIPDSAPGGRATMWADFVINLVPTGASAESYEALDIEAEAAQLTLSGCPSTFSWNGTFRVPVKCPDGADKIEFSYNGGAFPAGVRFSFDNKTFKSLGDPMKIIGEVSSGETVELWISFSDVALPEKFEEITLSLAVYGDGAVIAEGEKVITPYYNQDEEITMLESGSYPLEISFEETMLFSINIPAKSTSLKISYNGGAFPKGIRYKVDGEGYILSDREEEISIPVEGRSSIDLYIDFSNTNVQSIPANVSFSASAYKGIYELSTSEVQCGTALVPISAEYELSQMIIHHNSSLSIRITGADENTKFKVQYLSEINGQITYMEDDNSFGLTVKAENGVLSISNEAGMAKAGTYRIIFVREQNGAEVTRVEIPIFIHY